MFWDNPKSYGRSMDSSCLPYNSLPASDGWIFQTTAPKTARGKGPQLDPKMVSRGHLTWPLKGCVMVQTWYMGNGHCHQLGILMIHYGVPIVSLCFPIDGFMTIPPNREVCPRFEHGTCGYCRDSGGSDLGERQSPTQSLAKILISFKVQLQPQSNWRTEGRQRLKFKTHYCILGSPLLQPYAALFGKAAGVRASSLWCAQRHGRERHDVTTCHLWVFQCKAPMFWHFFVWADCNHCKCKPRDLRSAILQDSRSESMRGGSHQPSKNIKPLKPCFLSVLQSLLHYLDQSTVHWNGMILY